MAKLDPKSLTTAWLGWRCFVSWFAATDGSECKDGVQDHRDAAEEQAGDGNPVNGTTGSDTNVHQEGDGDDELRHIFKHHDGQHAVANLLERFHSICNAKPMVGTLPHCLQVEDEQDGSNDRKNQVGVTEWRVFVLTREGDSVHAPVAHEVKDAQANKERKEHNVLPINVRAT